MLSFRAIYALRQEPGIDAVLRVHLMHAARNTLKDNGFKTVEQIGGSRFEVTTQEVGLELNLCVLNSTRKIFGFSRQKTVPFPF